MMGGMRLERMETRKGGRRVGADSVVESRVERVVAKIDRTMLAGTRMKAGEIARRAVVPKDAAG